MSTLLLAFVLFTAYFDATLSDQPTGDAPCSGDDDEATCAAPLSPYDRAPNETLGSYLLRQNALKNAKSQYRPSKAMSIRMVNPNDRYYDIYWFAGPSRTPSRIFKGPIKPKSMRSTNSYEGHIFYFAERGAAPEDELWRFTVNGDGASNLYIFPEIDDESERNSFYTDVLRQKQFMENYLAETGRKWIHHFPRPKPVLNMWSVAEGIGHIHRVTTGETLWECIPSDFDNPSEVAGCRSTGRIERGIEVISESPRIFVIEDVLSEAEGQLVIDLATTKLVRSRAGGDGGMEDDTRTSRTAWLDRAEHPVLDTIYRRAADLLAVDEALLHSVKNAESMQVVHYDVGQEYMAHHDFGDHGEITSRMITLLFYLNDMVDADSGGETMFPKADDGKISVHPGKGNAVLFYDLLPDGNGDDKSLHEAVKLRKGEKWICNFWVWDPHR